MCARGLTLRACIAPRPLSWHACLLSCPWAPWSQLLPFHIRTWAAFFLLQIRPLPGDEGEEDPMAYDILAPEPHLTKSVRGCLSLGVPPSKR